MLIVAVELSSLCFFPEQRDLSSAVCSGIFGDGAAACVVSGAALAAPGLGLGEGLSHTVARSEHFIRYSILDGGYHLTLDRQVMHTVPRLAPVLEGLLQRQACAQPAFVVAHTGGRRILDALGASLGLAPELLGPSRASLREFGNTASVSVFDVLARARAPANPGDSSSADTGLVVAFGPGFTMVALAARWLPGPG